MPNRFVILPLLLILTLGITSPVQGALNLPQATAKRVAEPALALTVSAPVRVTRDTAVQLTPVVARSSDGSIAVAWEQFTLLGGKQERDIFVSTSEDGLKFGPPSNISHNSGPSRAPSLLALKSGDIHLFYADLAPTGKLQVMDSLRATGTITWEMPSLITAPADPSAFDPVGVEADDGKVWLARRVSPGGTRTDAWAQVLGGAESNLSRFGSAVRRPAIAAGSNGQIFVAWADHANELPGARLGINVREWDGQQWLKLPNPSPIGYTNFVGLAFYAGKLYCIWPNSGVGTKIAERTWDGTVWGPTTTLATGRALTFSRIQISAGGNQYVSWEDGGVIYLKKNTDPPVVVSAGVAGAHEPALYVDANETAYVAFRNNDVWLTTVQ
jgi:hypothetical protein